MNYYVKQETPSNDDVLFRKCGELIVPKTENPAMRRADLLPSTSSARNNVLKSDVSAHNIMSEAVIKSEKNDEPPKSKFVKLSSLNPPTDCRRNRLAAEPRTSNSKSKGNFSIFCRMCNKTINFRCRGDNNLVDHWGMHYSKIYQFNRYACRLCNFQSPFFSTVRPHAIREHNQKSDYCHDRVKGWTLQNAKDISARCFGSSEFIIDHLPRKWKIHNNLYV